MKRVLKAASFAALVLASGLASAANVGITGDIGTTGVGFHLSVPLSDQITFRGGVNYFDYKYSSSTSNVNYDFKLQLNTWDVLVDYAPFDGYFRLTGGLVYNNNQIKATGKPNSNGTYTLNGHVYSASNSGNLDGKVDFRKIAPYLGIGWASPVKYEGWTFSSDIGVLFQGSASTSLSNSNCTAGAATCASLANDVAAENSSLNDKVHNFRAYPVVRVGLGYRF